jgi:hypothetical protein
MLLIEHVLIKKGLPKVGTDAFAVLLAIASFFGKDGRNISWPGIETLCKMCKVEIAGELRDMPVKRMYKAINRLIEANLAERFQNRLPGGEWDNRKFRLSTDLLKVFMNASDIAINDMENDRLVEFDQTDRLVVYGLAVNDQAEYTSIKGSVSNKGKSKSKKDIKEDLPADPELANVDPVAQVEASIEWQKGGENRFLAARAAVFAYLKEEPTRWTYIRDTAKVKLTKKEFIKDLEDWLRYHQDDYMIMTNPVARLSGGKQSFYSWLRQPWRKDKPKKNSTNTTNQPAVYDGSARRK